eukprot:scaffold5887_cov122-Cylindrotheca_fusiformis.AAC.21
MAVNFPCNGIEFNHNSITIHISKMPFLGSKGAVHTCRNKDRANQESARPYEAGVWPTLLQLDKTGDGSGVWYDPPSSRSGVLDGVIVSPREEALTTQTWRGLEEHS